MQRSKRLLRLAVVAAGLTIASSPLYAAGSPVYVPLIGNPVNGVDWDARVVIANRGTVGRTLNSLILPLDSNGTQRGAATVPSRVGAGDTALLELPDSAAGLLELTGAPQLIYNAQLVPAGDGDPLVVQLPIISSENVFAAGERLFLQGWLRVGERVTDLSLVNLGHVASACTVRYFHASGTPVGAAATVTLAPLSHRIYKDVLQILGLPLASDVRGDVTCDQPFFAFALVRDNLDGQLAVIEPSAMSENGLPEVGDGGGGPGPCPPDAFKCFSLPGVFFAPTKNGTHRETFDMPTGAYNKVHFRVEVYHGGWRKPADGLHTFFWLALNRHYRLLGMAYARGGGSLLFRHGINVEAVDKAKFSPKFVAIPGHTYISDYVYDTRERHLELNIYDKANPNVPVLTITDRPNVNQIHIEEGEDLTADFSNIGDHPNEPATIGWKYLNLTMEVWE